MSSQVIETVRLLLRVPVLSDAQTIFDLYAQDTLVTRYLAWRTHRSPEETERWLRSRIAEWNHGSRCFWVITRAAETSRPNG